MKLVKIVGVGFGCALIIGVVGASAVLKGIVDTINGDGRPHREWPFR